MDGGVTCEQLQTRSATSLRANLTNWPQPEYLLAKMNTENPLGFDASTTCSPVCCIRILSKIWKCHKWLTILTVKSQNTRDVAVKNSAYNCCHPPFSLPANGCCFTKTYTFHVNVETFDFDLYSFHFLVMVTSGKHTQKNTFWSVC